MSLEGSASSLTFNTLSGAFLRSASEPCLLLAGTIDSASLVNTILIAALNFVLTLFLSTALFDTPLIVAITPKWINPYFAVSFAGVSVSEKGLDGGEGSDRLGIARRLK